MNKKTLIWTAVVIILLIGGIFAVKRAKNKDEAAPVAKNYPVVVSIMNPEQGQVRLTLPYLALSQNDKDVNLASKIAARIDYIKPSGSSVKRGEVIARLDNTSIEGNIKSVEAKIEAINTALENMKSTHERTLELIKVNGASIEQSQKEESKIAEIESNKESLNQKLNELHNMLSYAIIVSPVNGNISKTMANTGDMAMPGHPLAQVRAKNGFYLLVRVPTDLKITGVEMNDKRYDAIPLNSTFNGLAEYKVYVDALNMMTGDRVEVNVEVYNGSGVELPFDAVLNRNGKSYVLVRTGDKATAQEINIIQSGEQGVVVSNNDLAGKEIVVAKQDILLKLLSGTSLKVKEG